MDIIYQSQAMNESVQFGWPEGHCDHLRFEGKNKGALCLSDSLAKPKD
jgi:hypothetical protein